jgi:DNA-binding XRE family transcriptional regulator
MKGRGNQEKGEKHGSSKLTETQVREIRNKYANGGIKQRQLALEYGVSQQSINYIIHRKTWSHI